MANKLKQKIRRMDTDAGPQTGRETTDTPPSAAADLLLNNEEAVELLAMEEGIIETVKKVARGEKVNNPREVVAAARLLLEFKVPKPVQRVAVAQATLEVVDPYALPPREGAKEAPVSAPRGEKKPLLPEPLEVDDPFKMASAEGKGDAP